MTYLAAPHWLRQTSVSTLHLKCCHHDIWKLQKILFRVKHIWCHLGGAHQYQPVLVLQKYFRIQKRNYLHQRRGGQRPGWGAGRVRVCMVEMLQIIGTDRHLAGLDQEKMCETWVLQSSAEWIWAVTSLSVKTSPSLHQPVPTLSYFCSQLVLACQIQQ